MDMSGKQRQFSIEARGARASASSRSRPSPDAAVAKTTARTRILVVEDQEDVRRMVATALEIEGYSVDEAADAREGLRQLRQHRYHLVLTDYAMPGGTGTWMLQEAARLRLMERTVALIVTAHPDVRELADVAVINKPLDLDDFLEQVRTLVAGSPENDGLRRDGGEGPPVELVLYISSTSPASIHARRNLEKLLAKYHPSDFTCTVVDLLRDPMAGESDRITFTPTLVKRHPGPRTWILGNLRHEEILDDLLQAAGIDVLE
jgi:DNA-binding response OmpR family regulator